MKKKRSWLKPDNIPNLIAIKQVDFSIFESGTHIPIEFRGDFELANGGIHLDLKESHDITLIFDDMQFTASLKNIYRKDYPGDTLQIRYDSNNELKQYLINKLNNSYKFIINKKKDNIEPRSNIVVPSSIAEYLEFYRTDTPFCYEIKISKGLKNYVENSINIWWVNQGQSINAEYSDGYLWAPIKSNSGKTFYHWELLSELKKDDIVLNYANGEIRFISKVLNEAIESKKPSSLKFESSDQLGRLVKVEYHPLKPPIPLKLFAKELLDLNIDKGPIDSNGSVKQGYLFKLNNDALSIIQKLKPDSSWPDFSKNDTFGYELGSDEFDELIFLNSDYSIDQCSEDTSISKDILDRWIRTIHRKGQAIIYGPPGTGKTYVAEKLARHLISGDDGFIETIQFHPAYAYEDFIEGIRPKTNISGHIEYSVEAGRFISFCDKARRKTGYCVLIIDEINRANISRVFGELMYLLEYRDREIPLSYGSTFSIPSNVRIIGTMNTADRSIALVDYALRRRFAFLNIQPDYDILFKLIKDDNINIKGLVDLLISVNKQIDDKHYEIGISFFLVDNLSSNLEDIWKMEIEPYLEEYFYDQPSKTKEYKWEKIREKVIL